MKELWDLFVSFMRIGGLTFGGGLAMLPMLQSEIVERKKWASEEELLNYYAVGQCTPGIIAVNTATFIGYKRRGLLGAVTATAGVVFPSLVIILLIAAFLKNFTNLETVQHAFAGIRVAVAALVVQAVIRLWKSGIKDVFGIVLFVVGFVVSEIFQLSPVWLVLFGMIAGVISGRIRAKQSVGGKAK